MKQTIILLFLIFVGIGVQAQCYNSNMTQGKAAMEKGEYTKAKQHFTNAPQCSDAPKDLSEQKSWLKKCNDKMLLEVKQKERQERLAREKTEQERKKRLAVEKKKKEASNNKADLIDAINNYKQRYYQTTRLVGKLSIVDELIRLRTKLLKNKQNQFFDYQEIRNIYNNNLDNIHDDLKHRFDTSDIVSIKKEINKYINKLKNNKL